MDKPEIFEPEPLQEGDNATAEIDALISDRSVTSESETVEDLPLQSLEVSEEFYTFCRSGSNILVDSLCSYYNKKPISEDRKNSFGDASAELLKVYFPNIDKASSPLGKFIGAGVLVAYSVATSEPLKRENKEVENEQDTSDAHGDNRPERNGQNISNEKDLAGWGASGESVDI